MNKPADLLLKMMEQLRDDVASDRETSRQSRATQHQRLDEVIDRLGKMETSIAIAGQIDAQVRTELDDLKQTVTTNQLEVAPTVEQWQDMLKTGRRVSWVLGISGLLSLGGLIALATWAGDAAVNAVRAWLRIS